MTQNELERRSLQAQLKKAKQHLSARKTSLKRFLDRAASPNEDKQEELETAIQDLEDEVWAIEQDLKDLDDVE